MGGFKSNLSRILTQLVGNPGFGDVLPLIGLSALLLVSCVPVGELNLSKPSDLGESLSSPVPVRFLSNLNFAGISSVSGITATSLTLNWTNVMGAASYAVYNTTSGIPTYLGAVVAPAHSYTVTGLNISSQYSFMVELVDTTGLVAPSPADLQVTTASTYTIPSLSYSGVDSHYVLGMSISPNTALITGGTASGFNVTPPLPSGLSIDSSSGQIIGTPLSLTPASSYTVSAMINGASVTTILGIQVNFAGITSITNITGDSLQVNWVNPPGANPAPASYNVIDLGSGSIVLAVAAPSSSAVITGLTPGSNYTYQVRLVDSAGLGDQNTVSCSATTLATIPPAALVYATPSPSYTLGDSISINTPSSSGGGVSSYSVSPSLPSGLTLNAANGQISGIPTRLAPSAPYTVSATNAGGSTTVQLAFGVNFAGITSISDVTGNSLQLNWALPNGASPGPSSFSIFEMSPTPQLVLSVGASVTSAVISGLSPGTTHTYIVRMVDTSGFTDQNSVSQSATTLTTAPPSGLSYPVMSPSYLLGTSITPNIPSNAGAAANSFSIQPSLPAGLVFNTTNGQITGTPTQLANLAPYTVTASNAGGSSTALLELSVNFAGLSSISQVTGNSMQLNWLLPVSASPAAASFRIFESAPTPQLVESVGATVTQVTLTGLNPGTTYTYAVRMVDASGVTDQNSTTQTVTTLATSPPAGLSYATPSPIYTLGSAIALNNPTSTGGTVSSYAISPALPPGLTLNTTSGQISGTPTRLINTTVYTVTATNAGGTTSTPLRLTVNFAGIGSITNITGNSLQLNWTLPVNAAPGPGSFSLFETAPVSQLLQSVSGLTNSAVITGLNFSTAYTYLVQMVDTSGLSDQNTISLSATTTNMGAPSGLTYATMSPTYILASPIVANSPTSTGGAVTSYTISPSLPAGLTLDPSSGQITGTPTQLAGPNTYTVTATNSVGSTTAVLDLGVDFAGISSITNVTGSSMQLNWTLPSGANPAPVNFTIFETSPSSQLVETLGGSATNAVITGLSPSVNYTYEVRMTDTSGTTDQNTVTQSATTLSTAPPNGLSYATPSPVYVLGAAIVANSPTNSGGTPSAYAISPPLPVGLNFNTNTGQISGTPSALALAAPYIVTATNVGGSATTTVTLAVNYVGIGAITNVTGSSVQLNWNLPSAANPAAASFSIYDTTSGTPQFIESVAAPADSVTLSGLVSGTNYQYRVRMVDTTGMMDANAVDAAVTTNATAPPGALTYTDAQPVYVLGSTIASNGPTSSGGAVTSYTVSPALPGGLSLNGSTGQMSGTPTQLVHSAPYTITASNAGGSTTTTLNLTVDFAGIGSITNVTGGSLQVNWTAPLTASPPVASYNVIDMNSEETVQSVSAPATSSVVTGLSAGTTYSYAVRMVDTSGLIDQNTATQSATTLSTAPPIGLTYSASSPAYVLGMAIIPNTPSSTGGAISSYTISPSLPAGLSFSTSTGQITGTPTALAVVAPYTVTATNAGGSTTATVDLAVNFVGIGSITNITGSSVQLNWVVPSGSNPAAASFNLYNSTTGSLVFVESVNAPANSAVITGLNAGTAYKFRVRMVDTTGTVDANAVDASATTNATSPPTSLSYGTPSPSYTLGTAISTNSPSSSGGAVASYAITPALPGGLSFSTTTGQITGTPTQLANLATYTVSATNAGGSTSTSLNLTVNFAGATAITNITGSSLQLNWTTPSGANPAAASYNVIDVSSGSIVQSVDVPATSTLISGLTAGSTHTYEIHMVDASGVIDQNTVTQTATTLSTAPPSGLTYATPTPTYTLATAISSNNPTSSGGAVASYAITPALPGGLSFSTTTGHITGTPTQLANLMPYTVTATNAGGSTTTTINLTVNFAGITSISNVTGSSLQLNWVLPSGASPGPGGFKIIETSPANQLLQTVSGSSTSTVVSGLSAGTAYGFEVRMVDTSGTTDQNAVTQSATTNATAPPSGLSYATPTPTYTLGTAISSNNPTSSGGAVASYTISPALPAGLNFSTSSGQITGTPTQLAKTTAYTVSATNAGGSTTTTVNLTVNFVGISSISNVTGGSMQLNWVLPSGASPGPGSFEIFETSPVAQLVQSVSGTSSNVVISGLSISTAYTFGVRMVDASGTTDHNAVTQTATTLSTGPPSGLTYATPTPSYTLGGAITANSPSSTGGAISSYTISPSLPAGLSFSTSTGQITGTPTALAVVAPYTVTATNAGGSTTATVNLAVNFVGIGSITNITGSSVQLNWVVPSGSNPAAASFNLYNSTTGSLVFVESVNAPANSAVITGLNAGTAYKFRVRMVDTTGTVDANAVDASATTNATSPPTSLSYGTPSPSYTLGTAISTNSPSSSGGAVASYAITPALPGGLSFSTTTGQITGTPTQLANLATYTVSATNAGGSTSTSLNLTVNFAGATAITNITGSSLQLNWTTPSGANPAAASYNVIDVSSGSIVQSVDVPATSTLISGLTAGSTHTYEIHMVDASGVIDQNTVTQTATTLSTAPPSGLTYATPTPTYTLATAISSNNPTSSGGAVASYAITPALPGGLSFSTTTGHITGTPTQLANLMPYTVTATNAGGSTTTTINLTVNFAGITSISNVTGSSLQLNWVLPSGASPGPGGFKIIETSPANQLLQTVSGSSTSTVVSGLSAGTAYGFEVRMVDTSGTTDQNAVTQSATTNATAPPSGLSYATPTPTYTLGTAISSNNPTSSGGAVASYTISPALPAGLNFSTSSGQITGTPTQLAKTTAYTVSATNAGGSTTTTVNLTVNFVGISSISNVTGGSMQLNWVLPSGASPGPGSFEIFETSPVAQLVQSVSGTSSNVVISGLSISTAYTFGVRMVDASGTTDHNAVTQTATTLSTGPPSGLTYATPTPSYTLGGAITANSPSSTGGAISSYTISPSLPAGLSFSTSTGQITGTPTALAVVAPYTVTATNAGGSTTATVNLAVNFVGIGSITNITGSSVQLNWVVPSGSNPSAASFNLYNSTTGSLVFVESVNAPANSAVITGLNAGTAYKFRVRMVDTTGTVDANAVDASATTNATSPPTSLSYGTPSPSYTLGTAISTNSPSSSGGAVASYAITPALPGGLSFSTTTGQITGTPTQLANLATYTVSATNAGGSTSTSLNLTVNFAGATAITNITGSSLQLNWTTPSGANPAAASYNVIDVSSGSIVQSVDVPATSTLISGLTAGSTHTYEIHMVDASGVIDQNTVTQTATTLSTAPPSGLTYATPTPTYTLATAISSNNPTSSGGAVASYAITPALPGGLSFSTTTGHITGTPTQLANLMPYTVTATNAGGSTTTTINLTVNFAGITSISNVTGSSLQLNWVLPSGASPGPGGFKIIETSPANQLLQTVSGSSTSTVVSGLSAGTAYGFEVRMVDTSGTTDQNAVTQSATTNATAPPSGLSYATPTPTYTLGTAISSNNPTSSGGAVASYTISPALPAGLNFSTSSGQITGTPTQLAKTTAYTVSATNAGGSTTTTVNLTVNFVGISSISNVTGGSMQLNWVLPSGASPGPGSFEIFETSPVAQLVQSVSGTSSNVVISGLSISTAYTFGVRMVDASGTTDHNAVTQTATTLSTGPPSGLTYATPTPSYTLGGAITANSPSSTGGAISSYTISPSLPAGLSFSTSTGQITGTPTALAVVAPYTVTATNAGGSTTATVNLAVNFVGIGSITNITGSSVQLNWVVPSGSNPAAASFNLYNSTTGSLVFVESVNAPANSAVITGLNAGTAYKFRVRMVDTTGTVDANAVDASATTNATSPPTSLSYGTPSPSYTLGTAISTNSPSSSGGAVASYAITPALPGGLSFSTTTGQITGTPTQLANLATYTVSATNAGGSTSTSLNLTVNFAGATAITNITGSSLQLNWTTPSGANPAAASYNVIDVSSGSIVQSVDVPATSTLISGLTAGSTHTYEIHMVDASGVIDQNTVTQTATTLSTAPPSGLTYATPTPTYTLATAISSNNPTSSGGAVASYAITPALPGGLSFSTTTGHITGTPTQLANLMPYTVTATNAGGSTTTTINLTVNFAGITSISNVTGSSLQLNWVLPSGASPGPGGFKIIETSPANQLLQTVSGSSTSTVVSGLSAGTAYGFEVRMVDTSGTTDQNAVTQSATTNATAPPSGLSYATPTPTYTLGTAISSNNPTSSGGAVASYTISPALPAGLNFSTSSGQITGTPTQLAKTTAYTVSATNAGGSTTTTVNLTVNFVGISSISNVTGGSMQLNWVLPSGASPGPGSFEIFETSPVAQLVQSVSGTSSNVVISGLSAGTSYTFKVRMVDTSGLTDQNVVTQSATTNATAPPSALSYATPTPIYTLGTAISSNNPTSLGGVVTSYAISPALPAGLSMSITTGQITGTPTQIGNTFAYTVTATNAGGSTTTTVNLTVNFAGISSITSVTGSSMQLNWALPTGASPGPGSFKIFETSPVSQLLQSVSASATSVVVSGLSPGTAYSFEVRMVDTSGVTDQNSATQSATTVSTAPPTALTYTVPSPTYTLGNAITSNNPTSSGGAVASYAITPSLPAGLSFSTTTGHLTGTPTQLSNLNTYTVTATNAGGTTTTSINLTVNFAGLTSISNVTGNSMQLNWALPTGASPGPGSFQIFETSPISQMLQSVSGTSPSVVITGLTTATSYTFEVRMVDTSGVTDQNVVTQSTTTSSTSPPSGLSYAMATPVYVLGSAITTNSPSSSGGTVSSYTVSPSLPAGLSLSTSTGQITGTPTALAPLNSYTITATNAGGSTTTTVNLTVNYAGISSITNVTGSSVQVNWVIPSGASPAASSFSVYNTTSGSAVFVGSYAIPANSAVISGLSTNTAYKFRVHMVDTTGTSDANTVDASTTTNATAPPTALNYTTSAPIYVLGTAISTNSPSSSGGSVSSYSMSPALPAGLNFSTSTGQITGTPIQIARNAAYTVTATNAGGSTTTTLNLRVNFAGITSVSNITGSSVKVNWSVPTGVSPAAASYSIIDTGLNSVVQTVAAPATSGVVTGLSAGSSHTYEVRMTDTSGVTDQNVVTQNATLLSTAPPTNLTYTQMSPVYVLGTAISNNNPTSSGGTVASYTISPALPTGLNFSTSTGQITGTPSQLLNGTTFTVTASNAGGSASANLVVTVNFAGITSITPVGPTFLQVNWAIPTSANPGPSEFIVYNAGTSPPTYLGTAQATASSFAVSGLSAGSTYSFLVRMGDTSGLTDRNVVSLSVTTPTTSASFQGWSNVTALGLSVPAPQATDLGTVPANVTLSWNAVNTSGSVSSYTIYRGTTSGGETYGVPLATGISTSTLSYTDSTINTGMTYYYTIAPVIAGVATELNPGVDNEITIITPPNSMALIHPWIANQEICGLMGRTIDRSNNYRCSYTGPGNVNGYYDNGQGYFVDVHNTGCNFSASPACGGAACIGASGGPSNSIGSSGNIYYDRTSGTCYYNSGGSWVSVASVSSANTLQSIVSNAPGLPPLVQLSQSNAWSVCQAEAVNGYTTSKRLMRHHEQVLASAWSSSLTDSQISNLENGSNLYSTLACNSNAGSGLSYSSANYPSDLNTLPGTGSSNNIYSVRTGSTATTNCISRYGIRDLVGNVWEYSSDQLSNCSSSNHTCQGMTSNLDINNTDLNGFNFDGTIGPGGGSSAATSGTYSSETIGSAPFNSFQVILGMPMVGSAPTTWDYLAIGTSSGQFNPAHFHSNSIRLMSDYPSSSPVGRVMGGGGAWGEGANAGRFTVDLGSLPASALPYYGFRCILPLTP